MPLKNYTSQVPASRSIAYIESKLAAHGARQIMKDYDADGRVSKVSFMIEHRFGDRLLPVFYKLPAQVDRCEQAMLAELGPRTRAETRKKIPAQAERTAWKIVSDWIDAQLAMVELAQVDLQQVMLPYTYSPEKDQTLYEMVQAKGVAGFLPSGGDK